jgi:uncharacterized OB-fold protein
LVIIVGLYLVNQGPQILAPVAEVTGQMSVGVSVTPLLSSTLISVPAMNYTYVTATLGENVKTIGMVQVEGESQVGFYIMNEGNFTEWRLGNPSSVAFGKPDVTNYNFTFITGGSGVYYFIFSNQDAGHKNILFTLNTVTYTMVPSPIIQYADFELIVLGILLTIIGIKTGKKARSWKEYDGTASTEITGRCKFCGKELATGELFCPKCGRSQS